jgi:hypothetical protein
MKAKTNVTSEENLLDASITGDVFHITHPDNVSHIRKEGLKANEDGCIYAFTDMIVADSIAKHQVLLRHYAVLSISPRGISGTVSADPVAKLTRAYHRVICQKVIEPPHIKEIGAFDICIETPTAWEVLVALRVGSPWMPPGVSPTDVEALCEATTIFFGVRGLHGRSQVSRRQLGALARTYGDVMRGAALRAALMSEISCKG